MNKTIIILLIKFLLAFSLVFLYYIVFFIRKYKKLNNKKLPTELNLFVKSHNIDLKKINIKRLMWVIALTYSIDMGIVFIITEITNILILKLIISLPCLIMTIYLSNKLLGYIYRGGTKNV